jgi:uncharacterized protein (PEP-CTERM system associated)
MVITIVDRKNRKKSCRAPFYILSAASAFMTVVTSFAHAAEWKIQPTTEIRETYSDNVKLAAQGAEKSDFVTEMIPGISIVGTGRDLQLNFNYAMQNLFYANSSSADTIRNQLSANAHAVLIDDLFFWDGRGAITQQDISPLGPQTSDSINDTGNRANVKTYSLSPYLRRRLGEAAVAELHYTHDGVSTNTALQNSNIDTALFKLDSGPSFKTLGWGFQYNDQKTDYGGSMAPVEMQSASTNLRYRLTPRFSWTESYGYEKNSYAWSGGNPAGRFWMSGFSWAPTDRTSISASAGKRFYGSTYALSSSVRSRMTIWSLSYSEDITTTQNQLSNQYTLEQLFAPYNPSLTSVQLEQKINSTLAQYGITNMTATSALTNNSFSNRVFLQKRLQGVGIINSGKSSYSLSGYYTVRTAQTTSSVDSALYGLFSSALTDKTKEAGASAQWNWKIYSRTTANIAADYIRVSAPTLGGKSDTKRVTVGLTKQMQPKLDGSIGYRHVLQKSSQIVGKVTEDAVYASLLMRF